VGKRVATTVKKVAQLPCIKFIYDVIVSYIYDKYFNDDVFAWLFVLMFGASSLGGHYVLSGFE
jgi:hypothetical protein